MKLIEHINTIDKLSCQITALLDLIRCADDCVDMSSISESIAICLTMHDELMAEVDKMSKEIKEQK